MSGRTISAFLQAIRDKFSSQPPVHIKIITQHDAKPGDPIWFDIQNNSGGEIETLRIDCANAFRNPAGMSFFRFNILQELPPETFSAIVPGSNRLCSHYQVPQNREDKVYLGLLIVKASIILGNGRQFTIRKLNVNALPSPGNPDIIMPSATFPATGNYITDLPQNAFKHILAAIKDHFSSVGRYKIQRLKKKIDETREKPSPPSPDKPE